MNFIINFYNKHTEKKYWWSNQITFGSNQISSGLYLNRKFKQKISLIRTVCLLYQKWSHKDIETNKNWWSSQSTFGSTHISFGPYLNRKFYDSNNFLLHQKWSNQNFFGSAKIPSVPYLNRKFDWSEQFLLYQKWSHKNIEKNKYWWSNQKFFGAI